MKNIKIKVPIFCTFLILCALALSGCNIFDLYQMQETTPTTFTTSTPPTTPTTPTTSTPSATSTPLPQMTPNSLKLAYEDNFSNLDSGWLVSSKEGVSYSYVGGEYNISVSDTGLLHSCSNQVAGVQTNFVVEVDTRVLSSVDTGKYGVLFRRNDNGDFYGFRIVGNQYTVEKYFRGEWSYFKRSTVSSYIKTDGSKNNLKVACLGTTIEIYVNGQRLATLNDDSLTSGRISLAASEANTSVNFDNFRLYKFTNSYIAEAAPSIPIITLSSLPDGEVGVNYKEVLTASGGTPPYLWELARGALPEGLSLISATGAITGTPTMEGKYDFSIKLTSGTGEATQEMSINISELVISTDSLANGIMNVSYKQMLQASGGKPPYTWSIVSGNLPKGLALDAASGTITGVAPKAGGPFTSIFKVVDSVGASATEGLSLTIKLGDFDAIDRYAVDTPKSFETSIGTLVNYLVKPYNTDIEKARVIYRWIAQNITYDEATGERIEAGIYSNNPEQTAEAVFSRRNGVCEGYSRLFKQMAGYAGLQAEYITGWGKVDYAYLRTKDFKKDHAWNAVKVNGEWGLIDSTWSTDYVDNNGTSVREFYDFWFLTPPEQFVYTHCPDDSKWQLLKTPYSTSDIAQHPLVFPAFFKYGLQLGDNNYPYYSVNNSLFITIPTPPDVILTAGVLQNGKKLTGDYTFCQRKDNANYEVNALFPAPGNYELIIYAKWQNESDNFPAAIKYQVISKQNLGNMTEFPEQYDIFGKNDAYLYSLIPGNVQSGTFYNYKISVPGAQEVAFITNVDSNSPVFNKLRKNGQIFEGTIGIVKGKMRISAKFPGEDTYWALLEYSGK